MVAGRFYHLPNPDDRECAAAELARVLRPEGIAFIALMPRLAFLRRTIASATGQQLLAQPGFVERVLEHGVFLNDRPGGFTGGYGVRPEEVEPFFARHGLAQLTLLSSEGFAPDIQDHLATLAVTDPDAYRTVFDALLRTAAEPSILGMSHHLLYVGQKRYECGQELQDEQDFDS